MSEIVPKKTLSQELRALLPPDEGKSVPLRHVFTAMIGRGYALLILIFSIPFLLPIPVPGLSIPFGIIIILLGLRLLLARKPWLPEVLLNTRIPHKTLAVLVDKSAWLAMKVEKILKPRLLFLSAHDFHSRMHAVVFIGMGMLLALPLPPGTNFPPALAIVLLCLGMMERDGYFIVASYVTGFTTAIAFVLLFKGIGSVIHWFFTEGLGRIFG